MDRGFNQLDISMTPAGDPMIAIDDKILITDSLCTRDGAFDMQGFVDSFPKKLTTSCLLIVVSGMVRFSVNFRDFTATDNSCVFIAAGTIIERAEFEPGARVIQLSFNQHNIPAIDQIRQRNMHRLYALQVVLLHLLDEHIDMLKQLYTQLRTILTATAFATHRGEIAANCLNLMASVIESGAASEPQVEARVTRRDEIVSRFLECVNNNYRQHRDLGFYAEQLSLSLKYMSHVVFEQTGRHPSQWIKDHVILDAKTMLRSGRYTVQQVAEELNFPNQSFFGKYFKEAVGVSPKKWK